ncbi:MAG: adenylate/guanylate cyclase domain-containing protein [Rhodobacteraceae bacterium]|nr:adenylate/guanylate cyclase domain-containing protein [Paracoccaceae bacterium]
MRDAARNGGVVRAEIAVQHRRRPIVIDATFRIALERGEALLVAECQNITRLRQTECMIDADADMTERRAREMEKETARLEGLLMDALRHSSDPGIGTFGPTAPRRHEAATVLTLDVMGPVNPSMHTEPLEGAAELSEIFAGFYRIAGIHGCLRIRTAGQTYLAVAGLPPRGDHEHAMAAAPCATTMLQFLEQRNGSCARPWCVRAGLAAGAVVASTFGESAQIIDLLGPAVIVASLLRERCAPMEALAPLAMLAQLSETFEVGPTRVETLIGLGVLDVASVSAPPNPLTARVFNERQAAPARHRTSHA